MHQRQSTQITLYIYIKVLLVFSGYIGRYAGVAARVRHLGVPDLDNSPVGCDRNVVIGVQDLKKNSNLPINHLVYADDLVIMSPSSVGVQQLLTICCCHGMQFDILLNSKKECFLIVKAKEDKKSNFPSCEQNECSEL